MFRRSSDSSLMLGRDFFVELYFGAGGGWRGEMPWVMREPLKIHLEQKDQAWKKIKQQLEQQQPSHQQQQVLGYKN